MGEKLPLRLEQKSNLGCGLVYAYHHLADVVLLFTYKVFRGRDRGMG